MLSLGLILLAIGLADLVSGGLSGAPCSRRRAFLGLGVYLSVIAGAGRAGGMSLPQLGGHLATAPLAAGWLFLRQGSSRSSRWMLAGLGSLALLIGVAALGLAVLSPASSGPLGRWLVRLPYRGLAEIGPARGLYLAAAAVTLLGTANGVVRGVLSLVAPQFISAEKKLRGGRYIGAIERLLIFGLAASGESTAALIVASAKSLLRFPELTRPARETGDSVGAGRNAEPSLDELTEYLVVGSLTSWLLALLPLLVL